MDRFFRNFDAISFWLGFLAGSLIWWLLGKLRPVLREVADNFQEQATVSRKGALYGTEVRLANDTMRRIQYWHQASLLFSLKEILVAPRLLAPPAPPPLGDEALLQHLDITETAIPYLPDWPALPSTYNAPTLSLAEALQGGCSIAVIGPPGSGKTVALAHLAVQIIEHDPALGALSEHVPLLVHVADLTLPPRDARKPLASLVDAISEHASTLTRTRLPRLVLSALTQGRAILMVDGLDELPPQEMKKVVEYLGWLLETYPNVQAVAAASPTDIDGLFQLGFIPMALASWTEKSRREFITHWGELWNRHIYKPTPESPPAANHLMVSGWLLNNTAFLSPLELTLKVWGAYAGDALGPSPLDAIEAHIRRMTSGAGGSSVRQALERLAAQMTLNQRPIASRQEVESWLAEFEKLIAQQAPAGTPAEILAETPEAEAEVEAESSEESVEEKPAKAKKQRKRGEKGERVSRSRILSALIKSKLVVPRPGDRLTLAQPVFTGYLTSRGLASVPDQDADSLLQQPDWANKAAALQYLAAGDPQGAWIADMLQDENQDLMLFKALSAARWLSSAPPNASWPAGILRLLAMVINKQGISLGVKARIVAALATSNNPSVGVLFRQLLASPQEDLRQLGCLGCGMLRDAKATPELNNLLGDPSPAAGQAALLALVAIGDKAALENVAYALLHGDENISRSAAEALANHPEEGYPTLEEGSSLDDPAVRRAAVFGLARVKEPWAREMIEKLRVADSQWVVQDSANQVIDRIGRGDPHIPKPLPVLTETTWLIAFAADRGMGVSPGKSAFDLLYQTIREGTEEQILSAIYYLSRNGDDTAMLSLYQAYFSGPGLVQETALNTLWHLSIAGVSLPPPIQYGFT